jgi:hypothetical protein
VERARIVQVLERWRWTIQALGQGAERLGLNPSPLRNRVRKLGIKRPRGSIVGNLRRHDLLTRGLHLDMPAWGYYASR